MLQCINAWRKKKSKYFNDLPNFELHLLITGLVYRDVHAAAFYEEGAILSPPLPVYFSNSLFTHEHYDAIKKSIQHISESIPVEGKEPTPFVAPQPFPPPESISRTIKPKRVPKPRKKVTDKQKIRDQNPSDQQLKVAGSSGHAQQASITARTPSTPQPSDDKDPRGVKRGPTTPTTPRKGNSKKKVRIDEPAGGPRRSKREHVPSKRNAGLEDLPTPKNIGKKTKSGRRR